MTAKHCGIVDDWRKAWRDAGERLLAQAKGRAA